MKNIIVIIRVYDRVEDLKYCLQIIKRTWLACKYDICVVSNGKSAGYIIPDEILNSVDSSVILEDNVGHLKGNSQLLLAGFDNVNISSYDYCIILEADTWLYTDIIITKYIDRLEETGAVWASAQWYDRFLSLATDFAIVKTSFLKDNREIFDFSTFPECYVCNYILDRGYQFINIKENEKVLIPGFLKKWPFAPKGRFYVFPKSRMVTHHIEHLRGGMLEKKSMFNTIAGKHFFSEANKPSVLVRNVMIISQFMDGLMPRRSWLCKCEKFDYTKEYLGFREKYFKKRKE